MSSTSTKNTQHTVESGDTLGRIATQFNVSLEDLLAANPEIQDPDRIRIGQVIVIPAPATQPVDPDKQADVQDQSSDSAGEPDVDDQPIHSETDPNAILFEAESQGASDKTAKQDKLPQNGIRGVKASETMARTDRRLVMPYKAKFIVAARKFAFPPALLAAIASRETRGGSPHLLDDRGFGDGGHGFGIMQVDNRHGQEPVTTGGPFGQAHINQATGILKGKLHSAESDFSDLSPVEQLQAAVSRYNGGHQLAPPRSDEGTTGEDYMNDVWARARLYATVEEWNV